MPHRPDRGEENEPRIWYRRARRLTPVLAIVVAVLALPVAFLSLLPAILGLFVAPLPPGTDLYAVNRPLAFTFLGAHGQPIGHRGAVVGKKLALKDMPPYLPAAFIAMEDRRFYRHHGIDPIGLVRAAWTDLVAGHIVEGGSTITQQTAKIVFTNRERTFSRKLHELFDAIRLEKSLGKNRILGLYLNRIYLGSGAYGVDGAAHVYFGISARHVTLAQAAMLATLTRAPSVFSPRRDLAKAQARAAHVLDAMVETGAITPAQAAQAKAHPASVVDRTGTDARNYFLDIAADKARRLASAQGRPPDADLVVHTTMEPRIQDGARKAAVRVITKYGRHDRVHQVAVVVMKPDGAVSGLVGGLDYDDSVFDRATQARRQPGSAFKPFVYLAAMEAGLSPWDTREDQPVDINGYKPHNFGDRYYGTQTLAGALAHSVNTITVNLAQEVGIKKVIAAARACGITSPLQPNPSLALGTSEVSPLELTAAYAAFANGGYRIHPYFVTEVDDAAGKVLYRRVPPPPRRVMSRAVDRDMLAMMWNVMVAGTGRRAALGAREAAGKTGTTQDSKDAWFVGFTTDYVAGVWMGNDDSSPTRGVTGGTLPATIWKTTMLAAEKGLPLKPLDRAPPQPPNDQSWFFSDEPPSSDGWDNPSPQTGTHHHGGILSWLFGDDDDDDEQSRPPPPPPGRPPPPSPGFYR